MISLIDLYRNNDVNAIKTLISDPCFNTFNYDERESNGNTIFHIICYNNNTTLVELFVNNNNIKYHHFNIKNRYGQSAFLLACLRGNLETVKILVSKYGIIALNVDDSSDGTSVFLNACYSNNTELVKFLAQLLPTEEIIRSNSSGNNALLNACYGGKIEILKFLISTGKFNINQENFCNISPICASYEHGHAEAFKILLKQKDIVLPEKMYYRLNDLTNKHVMLDLIESYKKNPVLTRSQLLLEDNIYIYHLLVFLCDDYYTLNKDTDNINGLRFFEIIRMLPIEIMMIIIHRLSESQFDYISRQQFEKSLKTFIEKYY